jgi:hypothetical protein
MSEIDAVDDCCAVAEESGAATTAACPSCGTVGRTVGDVTVSAMLPRDTALRVLGLERRFCKTPSCSVLYYGVDGRTVDKSEARIRIALKEAAPPTTICYCFDVSAEDLRREVVEHGRAPSAERIKAEVRAGACDCERKNPSGACCLGEINAIVKLATSSKPKKGCCG